MNLQSNYKESIHFGNDGRIWFSLFKSDEDTYKALLNCIADLPNLEGIIVHGGEGDAVLTAHICYVCMTHGLKINVVSTRSAGNYFLASNSRVNDLDSVISVAMHPMGYPGMSASASYTSMQTFHNDLFVTPGVCEAFDERTFDMITLLNCISLFHGQRISKHGSAPLNNWIWPKEVLTKCWTGIKSTYDHPHESEEAFTAFKNYLLSVFDVDELNITKLINRDDYATYF